MPPQSTNDTCSWCNTPLNPRQQRHRAKTCSKRCRQSLWRFHVTPAAIATNDAPITVAYADPPYPGKAHYYPEKTEIDHARLIRHLTTHYPDGWALSTSASALRDILALCPTDTRVCAWLKAGRPNKHARCTTTWEPLLIHWGPKRHSPEAPSTRDALIARGRFRDTQMLWLE